MKYDFWIEATADQAVAATIQNKLAVSRPVAALLASRGITSAAEAHRFLNSKLSDTPDPFLMPDMDAAVERIWKAILQKEHILVHGDYDADGITGSAIVIRFLRELGASPSWFIPDRIEDGYGFSKKCFHARSKQEMPSLIITVDCGTGSSADLLAAREAGIDVVVTDHHELTNPTVGAYAFVNPWRLEQKNGIELSGAGVAFKLCYALLKKGLKEKYPNMDHLDLRHYLDLAAIGTVADVCPLVGENRIIVNAGLERIAHSRWPGVKALLATGKAPVGVIESYLVAFVLAPRINAAGRVGDAGVALKLLLEDQPDVALELADTLEEMNCNRRYEETKLLESIREKVKENLPVDGNCGIAVAGQGWSPGLIGIIASRLVNEYGVPATVISINEKGEGRGSCRGVDAIDVTEVLKRCASCLSSFGGHKSAGGFTVKVGQIQEFCAMFVTICTELLGGVVPPKSIAFDGWLSPGEINMDFLKELAFLKPFGAGNPTPVWGLRSCRLSSEPRILKDKHLKFVLQAGVDRFDAIAFNMADHRLPDGEMDLLFEATINEFRGLRSIQLKVLDFRATNL